MAGPSIPVSGLVATNGTAATPTPAVNLPATVVAGETLLVLIRVAVAGAIGWPGGWTELFDTSADAADDQMAMAWKKADGSEGGTSITLSSGNGKFAAIAWRIQGATDPTVTPPQVNTAVIGTDANPNPGALTPTGGAKDYLWLWIGGWEAEQTSPPAGNPTNYTLANSKNGADSGTAGVIATNCRVATAGRQLNAASEDPPVWVISAADDWTAYTVAVHPAPPSQTISGAGNIGSAEVFGTAKINRTASPSGIASAVAFGTLVIALTIAAVGGIASGEVFGTAKVNRTVSPVGTASAEVFGTAKVNRTVLPSGIASAEAIGSHSVTLFLQTVSGAGNIASGEAFGSTKVNRTVSPPSIGSSEAFGSAQINRTVAPSAIGSAEAFGTEKINRTLSPAAIASVETFGTAKISRTVSPSGIASAQAFGNATVTPGTGGQTVSNAGNIASVEAFGTAKANRTVVPGGIASTEAIGSVRLNRTIVPAGVASSEILGTARVNRTSDRLTVTGPKAISPTGITSAEDFGAIEIENLGLRNKAGIKETLVAAHPQDTSHAVTARDTSHVVGGGNNLASPRRRSVGGSHRQ